LERPEFALGLFLLEIHAVHASSVGSEVDAFVVTATALGRYAL